MQMSSASSAQEPDPTILVVEDDRLLRRMAVETLCTDGLAAVGVDSATEGLAMLGSHEGIGLLITDINMPGMNGLELLAIVQERHPALRRMVISGRPYLDRDSVPPATDILAKPFTASQFLFRVRRLMQDRPGN